MVNSSTDKIFHTDGKAESRQELHCTADLENIRRPEKSKIFENDSTRYLKMKRDIKIFANVTTFKNDEIY